jgi:hypothetical protein
MTKMKSERTSPEIPVRHLHKSCNCKQEPEQLQRKNSLEASLNELKQPNTGNPWCSGLGIQYSPGDRELRKRELPKGKD